MKCYMCRKNKNNIYIYFSTKINEYFWIHKDTQVEEHLSPICEDCVIKYTLVRFYYSNRGRYVICYNYPLFSWSWSWS